MYKIISRRTSFLERAITFSVDGKVETISAPVTKATFDDLILRIEQKYGANTTDENVAPGTSKEPEKAEPEEEKKTKRGRKTSTKAENAN